MYEYFHYDNQTFGFKDSRFIVLLLWTYFRGSWVVVLRSSLKKTFKKISQNLKENTGNRVLIAFVFKS